MTSYGSAVDPESPRFVNEFEVLVKDEQRNLGVLRRVRAKGDRRTVRLELTAAGKRLYPRILDALVEVFNRLLRGFSKSEVRQLEVLLKRMVANA